MGLSSVLRFFSFFLRRKTKKEKKGLGLGVWPCLSLFSWPLGSCSRMKSRGVSWFRHGKPNCRSSIMIMIITRYYYSYFICLPKGSASLRAYLGDNLIRESLLFLFLFLKGDRRSETRKKKGGRKDSKVKFSPLPLSLSSNLYLPKHQSITTPPPKP